MFLLPLIYVLRNSSEQSFYVLFHTLWITGVRLDSQTFTLRYLITSQLYAISCCGWNTSKDMKLKSMTMSLLEVKLPKQLLKREFSRHLKIGTRWNFAFVAFSHFFCLRPDGRCHLHQQALFALLKLGCRLMCQTLVSLSLATGGGVFLF